MSPNLKYRAHIPDQRITGRETFACNTHILHGGKKRKNQAYQGLLHKLANSGSKQAQKQAKRQTETLTESRLHSSGI
jgi:hypothetical protein